MLLPALKQAKEKARVISCMSNQKQLGLALGSYGSDFTEYPTNYSDGTALYPGNWGDESCGKWFGAPQAPTETNGNPNDTDEDPGINNTNGAWYRLAGAGYVPYKRTASNWIPTGINVCAGNLDTGWTYRGGSVGYTFGLYTYNGPHAFNTGNNGSLNGMHRLGRHKQGVSHGVRLIGNCPKGFNWSQIAFLGCPTVYHGSGIMKEPHGFQSFSAYCQYDAGFTGSYPLANYHYDRNYLYGDLHGEYIHATTREYIP
ncbi:MAG TPA: hypothetical protein DET40_25630 [Lentisphaeria bacterium]|nr:MAG: hypothetical protein A2X45_14715 [Lentisphaerae bacterium GWF2_50_93]HCE46942.1 hypothetical protein [Lentisphaeria bacterium]